jgi:glutathione S-transferase
MIQVFHAPRARSTRVLWMLEELKVPYEVFPIDFFAPRPAEIFEISPTGSLPAFRDGNVTMIESMAIVDYLGERFGPTPLVPKYGDPSFPAYLQFLHYGEASLAAPLSVVVGARFRAPEGEKDNWSARAARETVVKRLGLVVSALKRSPYVAGQVFTAADISVGYMLTLAGLAGIGEELDPILVEYLGRLKARSAFIKATADQG